MDGRYEAIKKMRNQIPMAQGQSSKFISMSKWIRVSRLSIKKSLSVGCRVYAGTDLIVDLQLARDSRGAMVWGAGCRV